jgi:hypothetical protein
MWVERHSKRLGKALRPRLCRDHTACKQARQIEPFEGKSAFLVNPDLRVTLPNGRASLVSRSIRPVQSVALGRLESWPFSPFDPRSADPNRTSVSRPLP